MKNHKMYVYYEDEKCEKMEFETIQDMIYTARKVFRENGAKRIVIDFTVLENEKEVAKFYQGIVFFRNYMFNQD